MNSTIIKKENQWYTSTRGWILFLVINMSGNLCFEILLPYKLIISILFAFISFKVINEKAIRGKHIFIITLWLLLLLLPALYLINYNISSTLHVFLKISIGILTILYCNQYFCKFYVNILFFFAVISLICFSYNCLVGVLPYIPVNSTEVDGGYVFRVSSVLYTQLYDPISETLTIRNSGPFWEPGAFQGFLNLALLLNILFNNQNKYWMLKNIIFVITIITTFSTGGYITLFAILLFITYFKTNWHPITKILLTFIIIITSIYLYTSLNFLGEKIATDKSRTGVSFDDFSNGLEFLFGYGYDISSLNNSKITTVSALINLIKYSGIIGLILYYLPMIHRMKSAKNITFTIVISLILFNEPFLTTGPFWWGIPLCLSLFTKSNI